MSEIEPVDVDRCQTEWKGGSFMTFGPRPLERCKNKPIFIAVENKPNKKDGEVGSMSLCEKCSTVMLTRMGEDYAMLIKIAPRKQKKV